MVSAYKKSIRSHQGRRASESYMNKDRLPIVEGCRIQIERSGLELELLPRVIPFSFAC